MLIVDGNSLVHRAYWASVHSGVRHLFNGTDITGTKAFIAMFEKVLKSFSDTEVIVVFDTDKKTWRSELFPKYKSNRKEMPEFLRDQFVYVKEYLKAFNVPFIEKEGAEGDDLIGTICKFYPEKEKFILTGDHDLFQLIDDKTSVCLTIRGVSEIEKVNVGRLFEKEGLSPKQIPDFKAIAGDKSDNIPGVRSIGEKTAKNLLNMFGSLQGVYRSIDLIGKPAIRNHLLEDKDLAMMFQKICTVNCNVDISKDEISGLLMNNPDINGRNAFAKKYDL